MSQMEYIFGPHSVLAAIDAKKRKIQEIYIAQGNKSLNEVKRNASLNRIKVVSLKKDELFRLTGTRSHQGVVAKTGPLPLKELEDIFEPDFTENPFILILDSIEDPRNLGSIARSALCLGVDAIIIFKDRCAGPTPAASKVSAGALEYIPLIMETNINRAIERLKANGYWIAGLAAEGETDIKDARISAPFALIVGSEGKGIRPLVRKKCDYLVKIDQAGPVTSLNAGVAAAISIYECINKIRR